MYQAIIVRITTKPHPNADRIQLADVCGTTVVVGLDAQSGDLGVYFPTDGVLSHEFCVKNSLYNASARASLGLGDGPTGFFDLKRRVRAQTFRGQKSDGLWLPIESLGSAQEGKDTLSEGSMFDHWGGVRICEKWTTKIPSSGGPNKVRTHRKGELPAFPKHMDTDQWAYYRDQIPAGSLITITEKLHGTSHRVSVTANPEKSWWQWWKPSRVRVDGSRNVILTSHGGRTSFYGSDQFRYRATPNVGRIGEVIFGEIVGDVSPGVPIMPSGNVEKKDFPTEYRQYGPMMAWRYRCAVGEAKFYPYRIVQFNEDNEGVELSHRQVMRRATALGYPTPTVLFEGVMGPGIDAVVRSLVGDPSLVSTIDPAHIREGVVIRVDTPDGHTHFYKSKSFMFKVLEGIVKMDDTYLDVEENA